MNYVEGFVAAVPEANKQAYKEHASKAAHLFSEFGATRFVEAWGDDVPDGKVTDFRGAVKAEEGEVVVFSWLEYPDRATRDAANQKMRTDPRMAELGDMPFDGKRMIFAGFAPLLDERAEGEMGYVDGFVVPVPEANKDRYRAMAEEAWGNFREKGAVRLVEAWGDDLTDGQVTDYKKAVKAEEGETVVFSWLEWPSRETRMAAWEKMMADPAMQPDADMPFDGKRMFWGGFTPILES